MPVENTTSRSNAHPMVANRASYHHDTDGRAAKAEEPFESKALSSSAHPMMTNMTSRRDTGGRTTKLGEKRARVCRTACVMSVFLGALELDIERKRSLEVDSHGDIC